MTSKWLSCQGVPLVGANTNMYNGNQVLAEKGNLDEIIRPIFYSPSVVYLCIKICSMQALKTELGIPFCLSVHASV